MICFIDQDVIVRIYPNSWKEELIKLSDLFPKITIFWHENCLEDELNKVLQIPGAKKKELNNKANKNPELFINKTYWRRLIGIIKEYKSHPTTTT